MHCNELTSFSVTGMMGNGFGASSIAGLQLQQLIALWKVSAASTCGGFDLDIFESEYQKGAARPRSRRQDVSGETNGR